MCPWAYFSRNHRICNSREITPVYGTCEDKLSILKIIIQLRISLCISFAPCIIVFTIRNKTTEWFIQWSIILNVKRDSGIFTQIRASFLSFRHPGLSKRGRFGHPRVEIRASLDQISPPRLAMCRRLHQKVCGLDKDTHQISKPKGHPLKTCNNDVIALGKFLPSEASAILGCPKLEFRAPVGALWYSLMLLRRGALLFFKVIRQISRSHGTKNRRIWPRLGVSGL